MKSHTSQHKIQQQLNMVTGASKKKIQVLKNKELTLESENKAQKTINNKKCISSAFVTIITATIYTDIF